ncbi:hypothetical protein BC332_21000 [Capsicum chinense]|nr:hypothetical protein BC332_21000 [Capsicum chinense]
MFFFYRWSAEFGAHRYGSPELHEMLADYMYSQSPEVDMVKVSFHFVRGRNLKKFASTIINFMGKCYPGEDDLAIARAILMYLSLGNLRDANKLMDEVEKEMQSKNLDFPLSELMQFVNYLLLTLQRDALPLFNMLRQSYKSSTERDPLFNELLDEVAKKFYGVQRKNPLQGMFGDIFKVALEKCIVDIKLAESPVMAKCHRNDYADRGRLDDWAESRVEVNVRPLSEAFRNQSMFLCLFNNGECGGGVQFSQVIKNLFGFGDIVLAASDNTGRRRGTFRRCGSKLQLRDRADWLMNHECRWNCVPAMINKERTRAGERILGALGIVEDEGDRNLPGKGEAASTVGSLSELDCERELACNFAGEGEDTERGSTGVWASISNGIGSSVVMIVWLHGDVIGGSGVDYPRVSGSSKSSSIVGFGLKVIMRLRTTNIGGVANPIA